MFDQRVAHKDVMMTDQRVAYTDQKMTNHHMTYKVQKMFDQAKAYNDPRLTYGDHNKCDKQHGGRGSRKVDGRVSLKSCVPLKSSTEEDEIWL